MCLTLVVLVISQPNEYEGVTAVKTEVKQALGMGVPVVPRFMSIAKMPEPAAPATVTQEQGALVEDAKDCNHHDLSHPTPLSLTQPWPKSTLYQAVSRSRGTPLGISLSEFKNSTQHSLATNPNHYYLCICLSCIY